jgi:MFS family permease
LYAEDISNVADKESISRQFNRGQPIQSAGAFWPQVGPVVFLTAIFLINFIARIILSPLLPTIEKELGISHGQAGSFFFLISAGYVIGLIGSGFLASRLSHRITIVISTAGVGLALLAISVVSGLGPMQLGLFSLGFASGLYIASAIATITSLIERPHWGKAIAIHELAPNLSFLQGPLSQSCSCGGPPGVSPWVLWVLCRSSSALLIGASAEEATLPAHRQHPTRSDC